MNYLNKYLSASFLMIAALFFAASSRPALAQSVPPLGAAGSFAVLGGTAVTVTGSAVISGNVGVSPGTAVTGFPPAVVQNGQIFTGVGSLAGPAQSSALTAYNNLIGQACLPANNLTGKILGETPGFLTFSPGVYCFDTSAQLNSTLTLNDGGDPNAIFIFQIGTTFTTASSSKVQMSSGGRGTNVYWQVGHSATIGTSTTFRGNIIANTSINLTTSASTTGRVFALNGTASIDSGAVDAVPTLALTAVQSRKTHAASAAFDIAIDTAQPIGGAVSVEPRAIGTGHTIVFQFTGAVTATGTVAAADENGAPLGAVSAVVAGNGNDIVVTLTGVADNKRVTVSLTNVNATGLNVAATLGFLVGDVNGSRSVTATDILQVKGRSGQVADATNFKFDLNASGSITASDILAVKGRSGLVLPAALTLGGTISGLAGTVVLQNNGGSNLTRTTNGAFTFTNAVANSSAYNVTVLTQPAGQDCVVSSGSGTVSASNITGISVACANTFSGTYSISPVISYTCALGAFNLDVTNFLFSQSGATLSVTGAPTFQLPTMLGVATGSSFSVQGMSPGVVTETYLLSGTFQPDNTAWNGTFQLIFSGIGTLDCFGQSFTITGTRQ
jgi:hypothetical protein